MPAEPRRTRDRRRPLAPAAATRAAAAVAWPEVPLSVAPLSRSRRSRRWGSWLYRDVDDGASIEAATRLALVERRP